MTKFKVLITGAAGYIGSILTQRLLEEGYLVTVIDRFTRGGTELIPCCKYDSFKAVRADVRDERVLKECLQNTDIVIPLAALVGAPLCAQNPVDAVSINRDAVVLLLKLCAPTQRIIFPTTNSGYGIGDREKYCTEKTPLEPISLYGRTKVEAEKAVLDSGCGITLRLATVFGLSPRMRLDLLVNDFTYRACRDHALVLFEGHFRRNYIHIRDVAKAFLHSIENYEAMKGEPYNVGLSEANISKLELCERIKKQIPGFVYVEARTGEDPDKRDYIVSNEKIEATGFRPEWSLDRGISELIRGYTMLRDSRFANV